MMLVSGTPPPVYSTAYSGQQAITGNAAAALLGATVGDGKTTLVNASGATIYYGAAGCNASTGVPLAAGGSADVYGPVYVFCATTQTVAWIAYR